MNLLERLRRSHTPDAEALSALADARLAPAAARSLEEHVTGCPACAARLEELRGVKTMLAAMPEADVPRSFRLSRADVRRPARGGAGAVGPLRWAPALSGVAAALFVAVLVADVSTQSDGDGGSADQISGLGRVENGAPAPQAGSSEYAADSAVGTPSTAAAGAVAPTLDGDAASGGETAEQQVPPDCDSLDPDAGRETLEACAPATGMTQIDDAAQRASAEETRQAEVFAASAPVSDDDDGNRTGFRIVEIVAAMVAVGAAVAYVATRGRLLGRGR